MFNPDYTIKYYAFAEGFPVCWYYDLAKLRRNLLLYGDIGIITILKVVSDEAVSDG